MNKQIKFLIILPLLIIPFLAMAFWALGGGKSKTDKGNPAVTKGFNTSLPQARFAIMDKDDKMQAYQKARTDSNAGLSASFLKAMHADTDKVKSPFAKSNADAQAEHIQIQLAQLNKQISGPAPRQPVYAAEADDRQAGQQVQRLQQMMKAMKGTTTDDPEMKQLSKMLDQIQQIQNPSSVKKEKKTEDNAPFKAIPAIIDGKQKVMDGGAVKLKLTDSVQIKDQWIPQGQEIFGVCSVSNQRLLLTIQNIRLDKQIIPVNLTVFSLDGMPGIPAPEAEIGTAAGGGANDAVQNMQLLSMDQSLGAQAAAGGVNAAKGLFSKKIHRVKVKLKDRYPVLLKINH